MCLSTVVQVDGSEETMLCKNISMVTFQNGRYVFTDIMGISYSFPGEIDKIDLMDNYIYLKAQNQ